MFDHQHSQAHEDQGSLISGLQMCCFPSVSDELPIMFPARLVTLTHGLVMGPRDLKAAILIHAGLHTWLGLPQLSLAEMPLPALNTKSYPQAFL